MKASGWPRPTAARELTVGLVAELASLRGVKAHACIVPMDINDDLAVVINGTASTVKVHPHAGDMDGELEAWEIGFWYGGLWLGSLRPFVENGRTMERGVLVGRGSDRSIRDALRAAIAAAKDQQLELPS